MKKVILSCILFILLIMSNITFATIYKGDIDFNGDLSIIDVRLLLQYYINSSGDCVDANDLKLMDMDNNSKIDIVDVRLLFQKYINNDSIDEIILDGNISFKNSFLKKTYWKSEDFNSKKSENTFLNQLEIVGDGTITYNSSNTDIAEVGNDGYVTIKGTGVTVISAVVSDSTNYTYENNTATYVLQVISEEQKAIQELIDAYYERGTDAQYCSYRFSRAFQPEDGTSQNKIYSVCSAFTFDVYYYAFGSDTIDEKGGMQIPLDVNHILTYARKFKNNKDVVEYWDRDKDTFEIIDKNDEIVDLSTQEKRQEYGEELLEKIQIGDVLAHQPYSDTDSGHAMIVYDIVYDSFGNPIDAIIRESTSHYEQKSTKITKGLSYYDNFNYRNNVHEGTFQEFYLINDYTSTKKSLVYNLQRENNPKYHFAIIRPLLQNESGEYTGYYYKTSFNLGNNYSNTENIDDEQVTIKYKIQDATKQRMKYSKMYIEKTVDKHNGSNINVNDSLRYTIKIKNNSNENYTTFNLIETIPENTIILNTANGILEGNTLTWVLDGLEAGNELEISYSIKATSAGAIISTGTVAGIPSGTIKNTVSNNLTTDEKIYAAEVMKNYIDDGFKSKELIKKVYQDLEMDFDLDDFDITNLVISRNNGRSGVEYYDESDTENATIYLNKENAFHTMVLNNYYGALYTSNETNIVYLKQWKKYLDKVYEKNKLIDRASVIKEYSPRANTIYNDNFQTGDVLIYKNIQTSNGSVTYETESGDYYLMYFKGSIEVDGQNYSGFIGVDSEGNIKNISQRFDDLQTLFGKDYYVVLRPSMNN